MSFYLVDRQHKIENRLIYPVPINKSEHSNIIICDTIQCNIVKYNKVEYNEIK